MKTPNDFEGWCRLEQAFLALPHMERIMVLSRRAVDRRSSWQLWRKFVQRAWAKQIEYYRGFYDRAPVQVSKYGFSAFDEDVFGVLWQRSDDSDSPTFNAQQD
jgi:hypothetical protein